MKYPSARALGLALGLFFAVYAPTFMAVSLIRPPAQIAVPLIIGLSLTIALALIWAFAQGSTGLLEFGFGVPKLRYLALAVLIGLPLALAVGWLSRAGFRPWMLWLYFGLGASIQEEVIFRGLIQSYLERTWSTSVTRLAGRMSPTV